MSKSSDHPLLDEIHSLKQIATQALIVVEGKKDERALRALGIDSDFYYISGFRGSIPEFAEMLSNKNKEVIVLTDFDKKGKELAAKLTCCLQNTGKKVKINLCVRRNIMRASKEKRFGEVEDLKSLIGVLQVSEQ